MESQVAVELREDYCSACSICHSLCPFEAIKKDPETGRISIEIEKCQVCGICYTSCPASAISTLYYDLDSLAGYLERARVTYDTDTLVFTCKGSTPAPEEIQSMFGISRYIPISVPCVGRIPTEFLIKTIVEMDMRKICILACEGDYCRFERGSTVTARRAMALAPEVIAIARDGAAARPEIEPGVVDPKLFSSPLFMGNQPTAVPHVWRKTSRDGRRRWVAMFAWDEEAWKARVDLPDAAEEIVPSAAGVSRRRVGPAAEIEVPRHAARLFTF